MRCEDCLDELPARHFVVHDPDDPDADDDKHACADCAGWYGGTAVEVTE
jgi:hypothetical protein